MKCILKGSPPKAYNPSVYVKSSQSPTSNFILHHYMLHKGMTPTFGDTIKNLMYQKLYGMNIQRKEMNIRTSILDAILHFGCIF